MTATGRPQEEQGDWLLPLEEQMVTQCQVDFAFSLVYLNGYRARIECPFMFVSVEGVAEQFDPEGDPRRLAPVLALARAEGRSGRASVDGSLHLLFGDGSQLVVRPDGEYEAWTLSGPGGFKLVALPGGGLAAWGPEGAIE